MSASVIIFAAAVLIAGLLGLGLLRTSAREMPADAIAEPDTFVDWDHELAWLLWDEGVWVEPVYVPASDEELLDLAYGLPGVVTAR